MSTNRFEPTQGDGQFEHNIDAILSQQFNDNNKEVSNFSNEDNNDNKSNAHAQSSDEIPTSKSSLLDKLSTDVGYKETFDISVREIMVANQYPVTMVSLNCLMDGDKVLYNIERLSLLKEHDLKEQGTVIHQLFDHYLPNSQVSLQKSWSKAMTSLLSGESLFFVEGAQEVLILETRSYPSRGISEPDIEKVVRGSRDGFNEGIINNIGLVRRRLRDPKLRFVHLQVGERTRTSIAISYIDDLVDKNLLAVIKHKIEQLEIDGLPLADKQLEEAIFQKGWSPFPLVRYSERPDTVSSHLLEGAITLFVDTSPSVMILPTTYFDLMQHAEENRQTPLVGTYLRWVRFFGILNSLVLLPIWLLFVLKPQYTPEFLTFMIPQESAHIPIVMQLIIAEICIDLLRLASVHTPSSIATAMSLVAAVMLGDLAVSTGWLVNEVILYFAIAAVGMFATPSYELSLANRMIRLLLIVAVASFGLIGFMVVLTAIFVMLVLQRSVNRPYMWPLIPFDFNGCVNVLLRKPVLQNKIRPNINKPQQYERMVQKKN